MRTLLITGGGGVGKTTLSAAVAVKAARSGLRTIVVTVDPARRLAAALGLDDLGHEPTLLPGSEYLWGAMLDAHRSWDDIARRYAPADVGARLVANPFFEAAAQHFPASQSYAAAEEATRYAESGRWDVVVVDTPPAAGGLDFFTAPAEMRDLIGGRLLRWLTGGPLPGRRALFSLTARPALRIADVVLGSELLEAVADFLLDLRTIYDELSRRSRQIESHLRSATTVVVTTAEPAPLREAARFFAAHEIHPDAVVFNRTLPESWYEAVPPVDGPAAENLRRWGAEAHRQARAREAFSAQWHRPVATVPWMPSTPTDPDALEAMLDAADGLHLDQML